MAHGIPDLLRDAGGRAGIWLDRPVAQPAPTWIQRTC